MSEDIDKIVEKIKNRPLTTLNLEEYLVEGERVLFDLKDNLFQELILREKDFRAFIKTHDWSQYKNKHVAVTCTADAIVPQWAFMLVVIKLEQEATSVIFGTLEDLEIELIRQSISKIDVEQFRDAKLVIKGCGDKEVPSFAYSEIVRVVRPVVFSLFYGEPCSTVPLYKRKSV